MERRCAHLDRPRSAPLPKCPASDCGDKVVVFDGRGRELTGEIVSADSTDIQLRKIHQARHRPALPDHAGPGDSEREKHGPHRAESRRDWRRRNRADHFRSHGCSSRRGKRGVEASEMANRCDRSGEAIWPKLAAAGSRSANDVAVLSASRRFDLQLIGSLQSDAVHLKKILAEYFAEHGDRPSTVLMLVGPEGDFTPAELSLARSHGCRPITLGRSFFALKPRQSTA